MENKKEVESIFEREFEKFVEKSEGEDNITFLQKLFIRSPSDYWNSDNRKLIAKFFFIKAFILKMEDKTVPKKVQKR